MADPRTLPCPHCGDPIPMRLGKFYPSRGTLAVCVSCWRGARLPYRAVVPGLLTLVGVMFVEMFIAKAAGAHRPYSLPGLLGAGAFGAFVIASSTWAGCLVCRALTDKLDPLP